MRNLRIYKIIPLLVMMFLAYSCSDDDTGNDNQYTQVKLQNNDGTIAYSMVQSYPFLNKIVSTAPQFETVGVYRFALGDVKAPTGSRFNINLLSVDGQTGVITYDNENGTLTPGDYYISVKLENTNGAAIYTDAYHLKVTDIPLSLQADNTTVNADFFDIGIVATLSYSDTSGSGEITSVSYKLVDPPAGFSINASTGEISKDTNAQSGANALTVELTTNLGIARFADFITVTVGAPPTLAYKQQNGTADLNQVLVSPWTAYSTVSPLLEGMTASSYEIILPETLSAGTVNVASNGVISVSADQNLPAGTHSLGVKVTNNSGIEVTFENVFDLVVEFRWQTTKLFEDNFNDGMHHTTPLNPGTTPYPDYVGYTIGQANTSWRKINLTHATRLEVQGLRVLDPGDKDHYLVRNIDITGVKALRVSFAELFGYQDSFVDNYQRTLYAGDSTADLGAGTFNPANWTVVMPNSDPRWTRASRWNIDRGVTPVENVLVDLSSISGNSLKLAWYIGLQTSPVIGQYFIDNVSAQAALAYPAEEN